jgi:hypothetical protein
MEGTSTFAQLDGRAATGWRAHLAAVLGAVEGSAASVPLSLGCATLVFSRLGPDLVGSAVLATMLALAFIHLMTAGSSRPSRPHSVGAAGIGPGLRTGAGREPPDPGAPGLDPGGEQRNVRDRPLVRRSGRRGAGRAGAGHDAAFTSGAK